MDANTRTPTNILEVRRATAEDAEEWDQFVESQPQGRFCHLWGFRHVLENVFGYHCIYLKFSLGNKLVAIFPSIKVSRRGWLISQPFNEYGGPLIHELASGQIQNLSSLLLAETQREKCQAIEVRGGIGCEEAALAAGWKKQPLHSYATLELSDPEFLWKKMISYEARKGVNKARKSGLRNEVRRGIAAVQDPFYDLYLISMKRLGVPPHSKKYFDELAAGIGERLVACWVSDDQRPVGILLGATTGLRIHIFVIATLPEAWASRPADLAHWGLIEWACKQGLKVFDFGSARYAGQIQFKKKWGVTFKDYSFYLIAPAEKMEKLKIETVKTSSRSMNVMATMWRWAIPLPLTRILGPPIRRFLTK